MNTKVNSWLKIMCLAVALVAAGAGATASAQQPQYAAKLQLDNEESLAQRANELIDVNLNENLLRIIPKKIIVTSDSGEKTDVGSIVAGLKGVYVRSYSFKNEGEYTAANLTSVRTQLRAPGWERLVNIVKKKSGDDDNVQVEVYMMTSTDSIGGVAILALEPKRLTLVNIVGNIDLEKLSRIEGQFGIPELGIGGSDNGGKDNKPAKKQ